MQGLLGKKIGMTRIFAEHGKQVPVTVLECGPCIVVDQNKDSGKIKLGYGDIPEKNLSKSVLSIFSKNKLPAKRYLREFVMNKDEDFKTGQEINASMFESVSYVDVTGISKGKGFQGIIKRYGMSRGFMTHGGRSKRRVGSSGAGTHPGNVHKGKKMPGHMGNVRVTKQNLEVVKVDSEKNVVLVKGSVPGASGAVVMIREAIKRVGKK
jgi:large subunit ribosomal protein L3